jgi:hypothetical protein
MTLRDDVRRHFEREAIRNPVPAGLRAIAVREAPTLAVQRRSPQWTQAALAVLLALAVVAGLMAAGALRHSNTGPAKHSPPTSAPKLLFHDNLSGQTTGRPALWTLPIAGHVHSYVLAATLPPTPDRGTVYAVDSALSPTPEAVGRAFGVTTAPQVSGDSYDIGEIVYYPSTGVIEYGASPPGRLASPAADPASAITSAGDFLVAHGLFSRAEVDSMRPSAKRFILSDPKNPALWSIQFTRMLGGVPSYGFLVGATFQVHDDGAIVRAYFGRSPISGSEPATLIDANTAWREVTAGHWYALDGLGNNGPIDVPSFHADRAQLCYLEGFTWIIPMWCFTDVTSVGPDYPVTLYYPALTPGTFDWTVPNNN